jgi:lantibiotic modifying enzyme
LLGDRALFEEALIAASFIDQDAIALDRGFDVVSGAAGCALALLALYRATNSSMVLETAIRCGHHILSHRQLSEDGLWRTAGSHPLAGFSHGMAGIGYAVMRLYGATGERAFLEAAEACHSYERRLFLPMDGNWPDLRGGAANSRLLCQWCHGAAGIGLARLGCSQVQNDAILDSEIATAIATTQRWTSLTTDHVCCGNFGRIEFLLAAAQSFGDQVVADAAACLAARVKLRAGATGSYRFIAGKNQQNPGFFSA